MERFKNAGKLFKDHVKDRAAPWEKKSWKGPGNCVKPSANSTDSERYLTKYRCPSILPNQGNYFSNCFLSGAIRCPPPQFRQGRDSTHDSLGIATIRNKPVKDDQGHLDAVETIPARSNANEILATLCMKFYNIGKEANSEFSLNK